MDDQTTKLLMKKVKKHKKWTEGIFINPINWEVNGKPYYMAGYTKNNESVATAYLTIEEEILEEALEAQQHLALFGDLSNNIFSIGMDRLKIDAGYFTKPLSIPVSATDQDVVKGREAYAEIWKIQQDFSSLVKDYKNYFDNDVLIRSRINPEDVSKTEDTALMVNMYQYLNLKTILDNHKEIQAFAAYLESTDSWSGLGKDPQTFLKGITDNAEKMRQNLNGLNMIENEDFETMKKLNYEKMIAENKEIIANQRKYIRYPK